MQHSDTDVRPTQGGIPIVRPRTSRLAGGAAAALTAIALAAPAAQAACANQTFSPVFAAFGDNGSYTLVPGGDFETTGAGWTLGTARIVADQSGLKLGGTTGRSSLELPAGATVTSAPVCAAKTYKSFRFAIRSVTAGKATFDVDVLYADGDVKSGGSATPTATWAPSPVMKIGQGQLDAKGEDSTTVRLRFTARSGAVRVDDVYIDPRYRA